MFVVYKLDTYRAADGQYKELGTAKVQGKVDIASIHSFLDGIIAYKQYEIVEWSNSRIDVLQIADGKPVYSLRKVG